MVALPDYGKLLKSERNVGIPGLDRPSAAYDLALYLELGSTGSAVLVVTPIVRLTFKDGSGANLAWTQATKDAFRTALKDALTSVWSERHELKTVTPTALTFNTIKVLLDVQLSGTLGRTDHSHWNAEVTKVPPSGAGSATGDPFLGGLLNGSVRLDSEDLTAVNKGGPEKQCGAVHEFGHMLGYLDEYLDKHGKPEGIEHWTTDTSSIMNLGEQVRPRHYWFFADWCNGQYTTLGSMTKKPIEWKVNGVVNKVEAKV